MDELTKKQILGKLYNYKSGIDGLIQLTGSVLTTPAMIADAVGELGSKLLEEIAKI